MPTPGLIDPHRRFDPNNPDLFLIYVNGVMSDNFFTVAHHTGQNPEYGIWAGAAGWLVRNRRMLASAQEQHQLRQLQ